MNRHSAIGVRAGRGWLGLLLLVLALIAMAAPARADDCSSYPNSTVDGAVNPVPPSQIQIDGNCTTRNFPASNPLTTNFSFLTQPGQTDQRWLIVFDNVYHTGNMSCNAVAGHKIWFTNGSSSTIQEKCQNLLIPVEKIDKQNPAGQTTAAIGVPFTYRMTIPILFDPATGNTINFAGSPNDLHGVIIRDDLNATGADLTYVSHVAYWKTTGAPVAHSFSNSGGLLTFSGFPIIPAGQQIIIDVTVVLNNSAANTPGTQFFNTAKWEFGRLIDGVFYQPLPGEWGVTPPMTVVAPNLVVDKTGATASGGDTNINLGEWGQFTLDILNNGTGDAWNVTVLDRLPNGPNGGMCDMTPQISSVTLAGAALTQGTHYSLSYTGAPSCELALTLTDAAGPIAAGAHLLINYRTQIDLDTPNGTAQTNVAGATQWFNFGSSVPGRQVWTRTLTNGTVGTLDHEDAQTLNVALFGYFFEKTVANVTNPARPAGTAVPGDTLRYTLRLRTTDSPLNNVTFSDDLGAMNASAVFVPGSLSLVSVPSGADTSNTNPGAGANGAGLLDIRNLSLAANSQIQAQFDITLNASLPNGAIVLNQADLISGASKIADSDDPNVNGPAAPGVAGDEDPTRVLIVSAPVFQVLKTSADLTGDPNLLLAGETLRYTITVKNVGTDNATDATIRDQIPVNTTYVAGSTTLNGAAVADVSGTSALVGGMPLNAPENPTPGAMRADASNVAGNVATITFDVVVNPSAVDGTIISNQGFVSALASGINDAPSDDPATPIVNDPTRDVVGAVPLLFAPKQAVLLTDGGSPGIVDPGDVLRYTITVYNTGAAPATGATLMDAVPANTTYMADSLLLNGLPVGRPDAGVSPLIAGIDISSSDLTPPLPTAGQGTISVGNSAVIQFDSRVNNGVPGGTLITNQATVRTQELAQLLTDGDGNPATGPEPTVLVVGQGQQLSIAKRVTVVGGGAAMPGAQLEYLVQVTNVASVPAQYVVITDDLSVPVPGQLTYVDQSARLNGSTAGINVVGSLITIDYSSLYGPLAPGGTIVLLFRATINPSLAIGATLTNTAHVSWNNTQTASASVSIDVGGVAGVGVLNGKAWHDANFDKIADAVERVLEGWTVELYRNDRAIHSTLTDANGVYRISGVTPNYATTDRYELRFSAPGAGANTALLGLADSTYTNGLQRISGITVEPGSNLQGLNLPIQPNGVVYNTIARTPIAGAVLTLMRAGAALPTSCFDDTAQQDQATLADGYYRFDLNFSDPACPSGGSYVVQVTAPAGGYIAGESQIIPPLSNAATGPFFVPTCPASATDAIAATQDHCEVQMSEFAPPPTLRARAAGTNYHLHMTFDGSQIPGSSQIYNNHIPIDPDLQGALAITKTTPLLNVTRGQLVPYTITYTNITSVPLFDVSVVDRFPAGFHYVPGSARLDGVGLEPTAVGRQLTWSGLSVDGSARHTLLMLLAVGAGVGEGEFVNRAQAMHELTGNPLSGEATARVRVMPDPTFDCTDAIGKVYDDANRNGIQDEGELGLAGVRVATARGLTATTDAHGRYHITCAVTPHEGRGSNFVLKLDDRTLPSGYRAATEQVRVQRATRGKTLRTNFAASIHKVVGLDLADAVFEPGTAQMRLQWQPRTELLIKELMKGPAVLRLSYLADLENEELVQQRLSFMKEQIMNAWKVSAGAYPLTIEPEVFWRLGAPPKQPAVRTPASR